MRKAREQITCCSCGATFEGHPNAMYCSDSFRGLGQKKSSIRYYHRNKSKPKAEKHTSKFQKKGVTVDDVFRWIQQHYEKTGVLLSYGKAVVLIEQGVQA